VVYGSGIGQDDGFFGVVDHVDDFGDGFGFGCGIVCWPGRVEGSLKGFRADFGVGDVGGYSNVYRLCKHKTRSKCTVNLIR